MTERLNERIANRLGRVFRATAVRLRSRRFAAWLGIGAGLGALFVAFSPWVPTGLQSLFGSAAGTVLVVGLALVVAALGLRASYTTSETSPVEKPFDRRPEAPDTVDVTTVGRDVDGALEKLREEAPSMAPTQYERNRRNVRRALADSAVGVIAAETSVSVETARERVETGEWTDDPRAAAFLGDVRAPPSQRLTDWLAGETLERRVDATVAEIRSLAGLEESRPHHERLGSRSKSTTGERGGGVDAGGVTVTDSSDQDSATLTVEEAATDVRDRWTVGVTVAFLLAALGFLAGSAPLALSAVVPLVYAVYGFVTRPPDAALSVSRLVSDTSPVPGEPIDVEITVENVGDHPVPEVRVVDGVPDALPVVDGTPRGCDSLRPGETLTVHYAVEGLRGAHEFEPVTVWTRNVSGDTEQELSADLSAELTCRDPLEAFALDGETTPYTGRIPTDAGGQGVEFYATREYQSTDPLKQIDWNFWARTGEPRTIEFRQNRAADVVVLLDDRDASRQSQSEWSPDAVTLGRHAAVRLAEVLLAESNAVGAGTVAEERYCRPARGRDQLTRIESVFEPSLDEEGSTAESERYRDIDTRFFSEMGQVETSDNPYRSPTVNDGGVPVRWLLKRLTADVQILFVTPVLDRLPIAMARRFDAEGHDVTLVSPDVTDRDTPGSVIERIERRERLSELRSGGIRVADWPVERPLSVALDRAQHRWSS